MYVCVHLMITDVMQCWIKHRELFWKDVLLHSERPGVGIGDVEILLAEHYAKLRLQGAEGRHTYQSMVCAKYALIIPSVCLSNILVQSQVTSTTTG